MKTINRQITTKDLRNYATAFILANLGFLAYVVITGYIFRDFMLTFIDTEIYPAFAALTSFLFTAILFIRAKQNNIRGIRFLLIFGISIAMFNFLQIFAWDVAFLYSPFKRPIDNQLLNFADMFIVIAILAIYLHFESLERDKFKTLNVMIIGITAFPLLIVNFLVMITQNEGLNESIKYYLPWFSLGVIFTIIYGIRVMLRIYLLSEEDSVKRGTIVMMASLLYMAIAFSTQTITSDTINFGLFEAEIFQLLLFALATSMLSYAYIINPFFMYAVPFTVHEVLVYDVNGIPIWDYQFSHQFSDKEFTIKSSALNAIGGLLREISGFSGQLTSIQFTDGTLLINPMENLAVCLVTERNSRQISWAFQAFSAELLPIANNYVDGLIRESFSEEDNQKAKSMISKYFPFTTVS